MMGSLAALSCRRAGEAPPSEVVIYTALDRSFAEPILQRYERQTGTKVLAVYDTESTKSIGLANRIRAERGRPQCDVFWNNEILNTLQLNAEGLLRPTHPRHASLFPAELRDPDGCWYGFAARARVLIVNTQKLAGRHPPHSLFDLTDPAWRGELAIAKPVAGSTATHVACLFQHLGSARAAEYFRALKANGLRIESGNKAAAENVGNGAVTIAWTDTDDAMIELRAGSPVQIVFPDAAPAEIGTLYIPNTLAAIANARHPVEADRLVDFLLSPEVEAELAAGPSAQIPLSRGTKGPPGLKGPSEANPMPVDFARAAAVWAEAQRFVQEEFLRD
ncbi:MAG: extracellular solute-binding protein [Planctomycetes bacterium]|nr:extracellular solute-binding protein [Planctomycetota bacterium]